MWCFILSLTTSCFNIAGMMEFDFYETSRDNVLFWISQEEKEKLFAFECEKKKEFQTQVVYDTPEDGIKKNR